MSLVYFNRSEGVGRIVEKNITNYHPVHFRAICTVPFFKLKAAKWCQMETVFQTLKMSNQVFQDFINTYLQQQQKTKQQKTSLYESTIIYNIF